MELRSHRIEGGFALSVWSHLETYQLFEIPAGKIQHTDVVEEQLLHFEEF